MMNHITIHGRLTKDPELRQTQSGVSVCNFSVAVDRAYKNGEDKQTDFFSCVAWRGLGELISKNFHKGKEILVSGEMQSRKYEKDGATHTIWELVANNMDFCGNKIGGSAPTENNDYATINEDDGTLPF
jgi:single-strand DNA-binding protein